MARVFSGQPKPRLCAANVVLVLTSETIMFLHQIFHQGLNARMANWPTLVLGESSALSSRVVGGVTKPVCVWRTADLFDILLPMLNIYQEFVRNHQYSLNVLANCKQNRDFDKLLKQYEANAACEGRMLETFLTYPMFQVAKCTRYESIHPFSHTLSRVTIVPLEVLRRSKHT